MAVDPITLGIVGKALIAIPREMAANLWRASYSTVVRESRDFSVGLLDAQGNVASQAEMIPMQTGGISQAFRAITRKFDLATLGPDDVFLVNDPFDGGQHLQDLYLFTPIFFDGQLVGFGASVAHHVDVGGGMPGLAPDAREVFQEGLRLPTASFSLSKHWNGGFVEELIRLNVRMPREVIGDLNAQFAANFTAAQRLQEMMVKYGRETTSDVMVALQDYAEHRMRDAIAMIPDGVYTAEEFVEADRWGYDRIRIAATVHVTGSNIRVDFSGTGAQVPANINAPLASTISAVQAAIRGMLYEKDLPFNEGCNRPISVEVPFGTILNPRSPAAVRARMTPSLRAFDAVVRALSMAVPDRAIATGFDCTTAVFLSYLNRANGTYRIAIEFVGHGWGAGADHEGADGLDNPLSNCANAPVEALEIEHGYFRVRSYQLRPDSGGTGLCRGGLGVERSYEILTDGVDFAAYSDRHRFGAPGIAGGKPGATGRFELRRANGSSERLSCMTGMVVNTGDVIRVLTGGGGGFGDRVESDLVVSDKALE